MDEFPPGYSASDVVSSDLPPGYKASDVVSTPPSKKLSTVNAQGKSGGQIYGESVSKASPYQPPQQPIVNPLDAYKTKYLGPNDQSVPRKLLDQMMLAHVTGQPPPDFPKGFSEVGKQAIAREMQSLYANQQAMGQGTFETPYSGAGPRIPIGTVNGQRIPATNPLPQSMQQNAAQSTGPVGALKRFGVGALDPQTLAAMPALGGVGAGISRLAGAGIFASQLPEIYQRSRSGDISGAATEAGLYGLLPFAHDIGTKLKGPVKFANRPAEILQDFQQTPQELSDVPAATRMRMPGTIDPEVQPKLLPKPPDNAFVVDSQGNVQRGNIGNLQNPDVLGRPNAIEKPVTRPLTRSQMPKPTATQPAPASTTVPPVEGQTPPKTQGEAALGGTHPNERDILDVHPLTGQELKTTAQMQDAADSMNAMFPGSNAAVEKIGRRSTLTIDKGWETKAGQQKPVIPQPPTPAPTEPVAAAPETPAQPTAPEEVTYDTLAEDDSKRAGNIREKIQAKLDQELPAAAMPNEHGQVLAAENAAGAETSARVDKMNKAALIISRKASTWADKQKARAVIQDLTSEEGFEGTRTDITGPKYGRRKGESEGSFAHRLRRDFADTEWNKLHDDMMAKIDQLKGGQQNASEVQGATAVGEQPGGPQGVGGVGSEGVGPGVEGPQTPGEGQGQGFTIKKSNPRQGSFDASIAEDIARAVAHGAKLIGDKVVTFAKWAPEMIKEFGENIRPHLVKLWDQSHDAVVAGANRKGETKMSPEGLARAQRLNAQTGEPQKPPTLGENAKNLAKGVWMAPSAWQTIATPFHSVLRHALPLTLNHPGMAAESLGQTWKAFASKDGFAQVRDFIDNLPTKAMADHFGVADTGQHLSNPTKGEEEMLGVASLSKLAGGKNIPIVSSALGGLKNAMDANHRGFVTYLDLMAQKGFAKKAAELEKWGITPAKNEAAFKGLAGLINNERGRGSLGPLENQAELAAAVMYAPRLQVSRIALMNPLYYAKLAKTNPRLAQIAVTDAAKGIGVAVSALLAAKAAGAEVPTDPRDSNFLKMKIGQRWIDPLGGFRSYIPLATQSVTGQKVVNGQVKNNVGFGETRGGVAGKLFEIELRKKLAPSMGMTYNLSPFSKDTKGVNRNAVGDEVTPSSELGNIATPFFGHDLLDYFKHNDAGSAIAGEIASQLGASSYEPSVRPKSSSLLKGVTPNVKNLLKNRRIP